MECALGRLRRLELRGNRASEILRATLLRCAEGDEKKLGCSLAEKLRNGSFALSFRVPVSTSFLLVEWSRFRVLGLP